MALDTWGNLKCPMCSSERVFRIVNMRWSTSGGVVDSPAGLRCADCHEDIDLPGMINAAQLKAKQAELQAMQEDIDSRATPKKNPVPRDDKGREKDSLGVSR